MAPTQANAISDLKSHIKGINLAYTGLNNSNIQSGYMVTNSTITAIQSAIATAEAAVNALVPVFLGNN